MACLTPQLIARALLIGTDYGLGIRIVEIITLPLIP